MVRATSLEYQRNFGEYGHKAMREPVEITRHGRRELVLMSAEHYDWLWAVSKRTFRVEETPGFILDAIKRAKHPDETQRKRKKPS